MFNRGEDRVIWAVTVIVVATMFALSRGASAETVVFQYSFPVSWNGAGTAVLDQSPAPTHDGYAYGGSVTDDVPTGGVPVGLGTKSYDCDKKGINTNDTDLLNTQAVAAAGGFTMEVWFKNDSGAAQMYNIINYAGTEGFYANDTTTGGVLTFISAGNPNFTMPISVGDWHYAAIVYDTLGNSAVADSTYSGEYKIVGGQYTFYLDSLVPCGTISGVKNGYGDSLNRPIAIGRHPTGNSYHLDGLLYEPRVTLGALSASELLYVPEPTTFALLVVGCGGACLFATRRRRTWDQAVVSGRRSRRCCGRISLICSNRSAACCSIGPAAKPTWPNCAAAWRKRLETWA